MRALEFITGHMIYNPAYTYKFQLKTTKAVSCDAGIVTAKNNLPGKAATYLLLSLGEI